MKKYTYTNDIGIRKFLHVVANENGNFDCSLWSANGEFCGQAQMTQDKLNEFLEHYSAEEVKA